MANNKQQQDGTIRKILRNEITAFIGVLAMVFSFVMFVVAPQQRTDTNIALIQQSIQKIESNHLTHLQNYAEEIKNLKEHEIEIEEEIKKSQLENIQQLTRLQTLIELHLTK
jgi:predicted PurR-regulated permease PerM